MYQVGLYQHNLASILSCYRNTEKESEKVKKLKRGLKGIKTSEISWKEDTDLGAKVETGRTLYSLFNGLSL